MWSNLGPAAKVLIFVVIFGAIASLFYFNVIPMPGKKYTASTTLDKAELGKMNIPATSTGGTIQMPSTRPSAAKQNQAVTTYVAAWNAQMGWMFANGGPQTTEGSLMEKNGVNMTLIRQDDYEMMKKALVYHARQVKAGTYFSSSSDHATFVAFMGDGAPSFLQSANDMLTKEVGPEYVAEGFFVAGFSYGEDKFMGPLEWRENPQTMRGGLVICVLRDGDFNICLKYCADNSIPVNPDPTTFDMSALNFYNANSFSDAAQKFITGVTDTRPEVKNGRLTGDKKTVVAKGVSTWLPGDQVVVDRGSQPVITIVSTKEYAGQMPCLIVGIKKFDQQYPDILYGIMKAISDGSEAVRSSKAALYRAAEVSAQVYNENTPEYWAKYFDGEPRDVNISGRTIRIELGGSRVCNLGDNFNYLGLMPGTRNIFKDVYEYFGNQYVKLYPEYLTTYPPFEQAINLSYLRQLQNEYGQKVTPANQPRWQPGAEMTRTVGEKSWNIEFEFGSAALTSRAYPVLNDLVRELSMGTELYIVIEGHTDNIGDNSTNQALSENRAKTVREYLHSIASQTFTYDRMQSIGYGEDRPIADNGTDEGRARNRRVTIKTGQ